MVTCAGVCSGEFVFDKSLLVLILCVARLRHLSNSVKSKASSGLSKYASPNADVIFSAVLYAVGKVSELRFSSMDCRLDKTLSSLLNLKGSTVEISSCES